MAAFLEDPRLRQRWNQISHNAETVTENAAAGIWTFQHAYVNPCLASVGEAIDSCISVCLGDREDRARRQRERARGAHRSRAEYSFDFYDDWYDDFNDDGLNPVTGEADGERGGGSGAGTISSIFGRGFFGSWRGSRSEDWDRLLAGSGATRNRHHGPDGDGDGDAGGDVERGMSSGDAGGSGEVTDQPRRGRGMSYSTRTMRRKFPQGEDPTVIPSTAPLGFLGRLPWKIGGTLRYKPSAANLREHPNSGGSSGGVGGSMGGRRLGGGADMMRARDENEPLLGGGGDDYDYGGQDGSRLESWQSELAAADASRDYGTAMLSVPSTGIAAASAGGSMRGDHDGIPTTRQRSGTTGSGETSDSFRSRGDLFPSDEEDDEDAVPLDDEFAVALNRADDRSSARTRFSSSSSLALDQRKGKKRADTGASNVSLASAGSGAGGPVPMKGVLSRSVSRTTIDSFAPASSSPRSPPLSIKKRVSSVSLPFDAFDSSLVEEEAEDDEEHGTAGEGEAEAATMTAEQLREEDERAAREEDEAIAQRREAAARLARERGLTDAVAEAEAEAVREADSKPSEETETTADVTSDKPVDVPASTEPADAVEQVHTPTDNTVVEAVTAPSPILPQKERETEFIPARLPRFN
ncbi:hypothetical protein SBRCBS47491_000972 [Sporothrix bragantina]|uniref:Uncharacterized protein n=1 Tax=Sporothrix bragantina TaxID=671064 RepID=A0ABP0AUR8_9PEZI